MDDHDLLIRIDESLNGEAGVHKKLDDISSKIQNHEKRIRNLEIKQYGVFTSIVSLLTLIIAKIKGLI